MTLVTPSQVFSKVSIVSTSILIRQTSLLTSTTLLVTKVLHLTTQVCSTALTFLSRWFVLLARTPSSQKSALRLATVSLQTHLQKAPPKVLALLRATATATTVALLSRTSCDPFSQGYTRGSSDPLFLYLNKNVEN